MKKIIAVSTAIFLLFQPLSFLGFAAEDLTGESDKFYTPTTTFTRGTESDPIVPSGGGVPNPLLAPTPPNPLPGDYDGNGVVNRADYVGWRANFGRSVADAQRADANGDGVVDAADYILLRNQTISKRDFNEAFRNWKKYFGVDVANVHSADFNGDGVVDSADYSVWKNNKGRKLPAIGEPEIQRTGIYQYRIDVKIKRIPKDAEVWISYSRIPDSASFEGGVWSGVTVTVKQKLSRHGNHFYAEGLKLRPGNYQYHIETVGLSGGDIRTGYFNFTVEPEPREIPIHDVTVGNLEPTTVEITAEADGLEPWEKLKLVYWREDRPEEMQTISMSRPDDQSPYQADLSGLTPGMNYRYKFIVVEEGTGQLIDETSEGGFTTEPHPPVNFATPTVQNLTFESADISVQLDGLVPGDNVFLIYWRLDNPSDRTTLAMTASEGSATYQSTLTDLEASTRYQFTIVMVNGGLEMASLPELREFKTTFPPAIIPVFQIGDKSYQIEFRSDGMYRVSDARFNSGFLQNGQAFDIEEGFRIVSGRLFPYGKRLAFHFDGNGILTAVDDGTYSSYPPSLEFPQKRTYFDATGKVTGALSWSKDFTGKITISFSKRYYSETEIDFSDDWKSDALSATYTFSDVPTKLDDVTLENVLDSRFNLIHVRSYYLTGTSPAVYTTVPSSLGNVSFSLSYPDRHENSAPTFMSVSSKGIQATNPDKLNIGIYWIKGSGADLIIVSRADRSNLTKTMLSDDRWVKIPQDVQTGGKYYTVTVAKGVFSFSEYTLCIYECLPGQKNYTGKVYYSDLTGRVFGVFIKIDAAGNLLLSLSP